MKDMLEIPHDKTNAWRKLWELIASRIVEQNERAQPGDLDNVNPKSSATDSKAP